jgi:acyl-CoA thioester hydrolase
MIDTSAPGAAAAGEDAADAATSAAAKAAARERKSSDGTSRAKPLASGKSRGHAGSRAPESLQAGRIRTPADTDPGARLPVLGRIFKHRLRVRYGECDPQGVVFNANYFAYFDIALTELWREAIGPYTEMVEAGCDMVVAEARARFLGPARFDDELDIEVTVTRLGATGMTTEMTVRNDGAAVVEGEVRHVFVDPDTKRKRPIPDDVRRGLEPYAATVERASA